MTQVAASKNASSMLGLPNWKKHKFNDISLSADLRDLYGT